MGSRIGFIGFIGFIAVLAAGCGSDGPLTVARELPSSRALSAKQIANPRTTFLYHDVRNANGGGLVGDGRDAGGLPVGTTVSTYDDGRCGTEAQIFASGSGDAVMDPIAAWSRLNPTKRAECGSQSRFVTVHFGTPVAGPVIADALGGHLTNVRQVHGMQVGAVTSRTFRLQMDAGSGCDFLRYDSMSYVVVGTAYTGNQIRVQRLPDSAGKRAWLAESMPNASGQHLAACEVGVPATYNGIYDVPLRIEVREK
jgi:hypothetical protein